MKIASETVVFEQNEPRDSRVDKNLSSICTQFRFIIIIIYYKYNNT